MTTTTRILVLLAASALSGCMTFAAGPEGEPEPTAEPPPTAPEAPESAAPAAEPLPATGVPSSCHLVSTDASLDADTVLFVDAPQAECNGAISYGPSDGLNVRLGAGALRFALDSEQRKAFNEQRVVAVALSVDTNAACSGCGTDGLPAETGTLTVRPMRGDWEEGQSTVGMSGADACRRTASGKGWGDAMIATTTTRIAINSDYAAAPAGVAVYPSNAASIVVPLSPSAIRAFLESRGELDSTSLSFHLRSDHQLVLASKEALKPLRRPRLTVTTCEP